MKTTTESWKEKAIHRREQLKELSKRRKELIKSRNNWKAKYKQQKERADFLEQKLAVFKKKLNQLLRE
ncbi:MAG TPA: hypothetical protein VKA34_02335 [Balneolales bacterium]|nr:hypothetical protein [Balneolales bacterium]